MIEFKAECGHTVRAKDDDAGGVVRCSYCGKEAAVPDEQADDFDFLFQDIQQESNGPRKKRRSRSGGGLWGGGGSKSGKGIDPFAVILKLCYAAALITVVVVVGKEFVIPLIQQGGPSSPVARGNSSATGEGVSPGQKRPRNRDRGFKASSGKGLIDGTRFEGVYVSSTPPGALGFILPLDRCADVGRINKEKGCIAFRADGKGTGNPRISDGTYVVEVAMPWNDRGLKGYPGYREFRRSIEFASATERRKLVQAYFLPDASEQDSDVFIDQTDDQIYIVRQYRNVKVRDRHAVGVRALFLPRVLKQDGKSIHIEQLTTQYIPKEEHYGFVEEDVRSELEYHGVPATDQPFVLRALRQIGVIPYVTPDGRTRLFKISIDDGVFSAKTIRRVGR